MGYNLYITRRKNHFDEDGPRITEDQWRSLVARDRELEFKDPRNPLLAPWSGESRHSEPWFDYFDGCIDPKNPDPPLIAKMLQIASELGGKVQGDDGEVYLSPTESFYEDEPRPPRPLVSTQQEPLYWQLLGTDVLCRPSEGTRGCFIRRPWETRDWGRGRSQIDRYDRHRCRSAPPRRDPSP
jgi:hypothetical protein